MLCLVALVGFAILMLAPGNGVRKELANSNFYEKPFIQRTIGMYKDIVKVNFGETTRIFSLLFLLV